VEKKIPCGAKTTDIGDSIETVSHLPREPLFQTRNRKFTPCGAFFLTASKISKLADFKRTDYIIFPLVFLVFSVFLEILKREKKRDMIHTTRHEERKMKKRRGEENDREDTTRHELRRKMMRNERRR
jgi:hypothetical protein